MNRPLILFPPLTVAFSPWSFDTLGGTKCYLVSFWLLNRWIISLIHYLGIFLCPSLFLVVEPEGILSAHPVLLMQPWKPIGSDQSSVFVVTSGCGFGKSSTVLLFHMSQTRVFHPDHRINKSKLPWSKRRSSFPWCLRRSFNIYVLWFHVSLPTCQSNFKNCNFWKGSTSWHRQYLLSLS